MQTNNINLLPDSGTVGSRSVTALWLRYPYLDGWNVAGGPGAALLPLVPE